MGFMVCWTLKLLCLPGRSSISKSKETEQLTTVLTVDSGKLERRVREGAINDAAGSSEDSLRYSRGICLERTEENHGKIHNT